MDHNLYYTLNRPEQSYTGRCEPLPGRYFRHPWRKTPATG